jgi:hypothetical protein
VSAPDVRRAAEALLRLLDKAEEVVMRSFRGSGVFWRRVERLRAALAVPVSPPARRFPIMGGPSIPWWVIAPHEAQARINHGGQTLERLADRGGLSPTEALAVLEDRTFPRTFDAKADHDRLAAMVEKWDAPVSPPAPRGDDELECYCGRYAREHSIGDGCGNFTPRPPRGEAVADGTCIDGHPHRCGRCDRDIIERNAP